MIEINEMVNKQLVSFMLYFIILWNQFGYYQNSSIDFFFCNACRRIAHLKINIMYHQAIQYLHGEYNISEN